MKTDLSTPMVAYLLLVVFAGCSELSYRTHEEKMTEETPLWSPGEDFPVMNGDTGKVTSSYQDLLSRTPSSYNQSLIHQEQLITLKELEHLESQMEEEEQEELKKSEQYFQTPEQKLYYLRLAKNERVSYLQLLKDGQVDLRKNYNASTPVDGTNVKLVKDHWTYLRPKIEEITTGMEKNEVADRWGQPQQIAVAGDPSHQNERWMFQHGRQRRIVFFENGHVVGWDQY